MQRDLWDDGVHGTLNVALGSIGVKPGPHRARQRCAGPVCDRPSASRPVPSRENRLQRRRHGADGCGEDRALPVDTVCGPCHAVP